VNIEGLPSQSDDSFPEFSYMCLLNNEPKYIRKVRCLNKRHFLSVLENWNNWGKFGVCADGVVRNWSYVAA
jgi:hypothetical protein